MLILEVLVLNTNYGNFVCNYHIKQKCWIIAHISHTYTRPKREFWWAQPLTLERLPWPLYPTYQ